MSVGIVACPCTCARCNPDPFTFSHRNFERGAHGGLRSTILASDRPNSQSSRVHTVHCQKQRKFCGFCAIAGSVFTCAADASKFVSLASFQFCFSQHAVIGFFDFNDSPQPPGYEQFYFAALRALESSMFFCSTCGKRVPQELRNMRVRLRLSKPLLFPTNETTLLMLACVSCRSKECDRVWTDHEPRRWESSRQRNEQFISLLHQCNKRHKGTNVKGKEKNGRIWGTPRHLRRSRDEATRQKIDKPEHDVHF